MIGSRSSDVPLQANFPIHRSSAELCGFCLYCIHMQYTLQVTLRLVKLPKWFTQSWSRFVLNWFTANTSDRVWNSHASVRQAEALLIPVVQNRSPNPFSESFLIRSIIPYMAISLAYSGKCCFAHCTYLGHYWLSGGTFHIAEWHFRTLILIYAKLWIINIRDLVEWNYSCQS